MLKSVPDLPKLAFYKFNFMGANTIPRTNIRKKTSMFYFKNKSFKTTKKEPNQRKLKITILIIKTKIIHNPHRRNKLHMQIDQKSTF